MNENSENPANTSESKENSRSNNYLKMDKKSKKFRFSPYKARMQQFYNKEVKICVHETERIMNLITANQNKIENFKLQLKFTNRSKEEKLMEFQDKIRAFELQICFLTEKIDMIIYLKHLFMQARSSLAELENEIYNWIYRQKFTLCTTSFTMDPKGRKAAKISCTRRKTVHFDEGTTQKTTENKRNLPNSRCQIYEMLQTLKYDARDKLKFTELHMKVTNASLENELRIRQKLLRIRKSLRIKGKFYKKKIYTINRKIETLIFGNKPTKISKTLPLPKSNSNVRRKQTK